MIIVSAGFDGVQGDPVGDWELTPGLFGHMTRVSQMLNMIFFQLLFIFIFMLKDYAILTSFSLPFSIERPPALNRS